MKGVMLPLVLLASITQSHGQAYVGTWTAELSGTTYVRLELTQNRGALGGRISLGNIHVDAQGDVDQAKPAPATATPIGDVVVTGAILSFTHKDGNDTDHFELRLIDDGSAELRFVPSEAERKELAADGIPVPKPVPLKKAPR